MLILETGDTLAGIGGSASAITYTVHGVELATAAGQGVDFAQYFPDAIPASPNGNDDEFNDNSVGGAWTEWDPGSDVTVTEDANGLLLTSTNTGSVSWGGVYRALPAGDWSIIAKLDLTGSVLSHQASAGIVITQDIATNPTTADVESLELQISGSTISARLITWSAYNAFNSIIKSFPWGVPYAYLRVRRSSTTYSFDVSSDGISWITLKSGALDITTPTHIGLAVNSESTPDNWKSRFRFYRQVATTTADTAVLGRTTIATGQVASSGEAYKKLAQGQLPSSAGTLYTVPASTITLVKSIHLANPTGAAVTARLYHDGTTDATTILPPISIDAGGFAEYTDEGWTFYDAQGQKKWTYSTIESRGGTLLSPVGGENIHVWRAPYACTVTNVRGIRVGGSGATINARKNGASNHLSSALSVTSTDTWMDGGAVQNATYAAGDSLEIMVVTATGSPTQVAVQVDFRR